MELIYTIQNYAWGSKGCASSVAQLMSSSMRRKIDNETPYAELWMGTHVNGPSFIKETNEALSSYFEKHPESLGSNITSKFGNQLCYLFKVLSVSKALSIQAHPNKEHAEELHKQRPHIYKDPNHKPEMAIAITPFQALCGFRTSKELCYFFKELPELRNVIGAENVSRFIASPTEANLKHCFSALINADKSLIISSLMQMKKRMVEMDEATSAVFLMNTFITLHEHYPDDGGCFAIYFLNLINLEPGEALFLGPNVIHAYLFGDCIECMACSDNVVRAGLTPKYQDVGTLVSMLEYEMTPAETRIFRPRKIDENLTLFNPPVPDFAVQKIQGQCSDEIILTKESSASILIVIKGTAREVSINPQNKGDITPPTQLRLGSVILTEANQVLTLQIDSDEFLAFRALCL